MNFCETHILPHILDLDMKQPDMKLIRERLTPEAEGRVLEIGVGLGLNLPLYSDRAREPIAIEPSPKLREMTKKHRRPRTRPIDVRDGSAEAIPLDDASGRYHGDHLDPVHHPRRPQGEMNFLLRSRRFSASAA